MYAVIIFKYFLQIRHTGGIMEEIEKKILDDKAECLGLIHVLGRKGSSFYRKKGTFTLVRLYAVTLVLLPVAAVCVVFASYAGQHAQ